MIKEFKDFYIRENNHELKIRLGLVNPEFETAFTPSVGAVHVDRFLKSKEIDKPTKYSIIEFAYRNFDAKKVGVSPIFLSLFEMASSFSFNDMNIKEYVKLCYDFLVNKLSLPKDKIYITIWNGGSISGFKFEANKESYKAWLEAGINKKNLILTKSKECFLFPRPQEYTNVIDVVGPRDEVYFKFGNGLLSEIATLQYVDKELVKHRKSIELVPARTKSFVSVAYGIERLMMVKEKAPTIFDISTLKPVKNIILDKIENEVEKKIYLEHVHILVDSIRALTYLLAEDINKMTKWQKQTLNSIFNQIIRTTDDLGLTKEFIIYKLLIDRVIKEYKTRYPHLSQNKKNIITWFKQKLS